MSSQAGRPWTRGEEDLVGKLMALVLDRDRDGFDSLYSGLGLTADADQREPVVAICSFMVPIAYRRGPGLRMSPKNRRRIEATISDPQYVFRDLVDRAYASLLLDLASGERTPIVMNSSNAATTTSVVLAAESIQMVAGPLGWKQRYRTLRFATRRRAGVPTNMSHGD